MKLKALRGSIIRLCVAALLLVLTLCVAAFARNNPEWVSGSYKPFSRGFQNVLGAVWGVFPFSAAEFLLYGGVISAVVCLVQAIRKTIKSEIKYLPPAKFLSGAAVCTAALYAFFTLGWGLNYYALPLADEMGLYVGRYNTETLRLFAEELVSELNALCYEVPRDENASVYFDSFSLMSNGEANRAKPAAASRVLSYMGLTGIFSPFTGEPNVNADVHESSIPFTIAHETAHSLGVALEKEANFAAYLMCRESDSAAVRYSGYLAAFSYVYNAYAGESVNAYEVYNLLDERVKADYAERRAYWDGLAKTEVSRAVKTAATSMATAVNDSYIQAMGQPDGVKSYGMVVDLMLAEFMSTNSD